MKFIKKFACFCMIVSMISCQHKTSIDEINPIVKEWLGKEIIFPANVTYKVRGHDTLCSDIENKPFKILTYIDSVGCTGCKFDLYQWNRLIDSCNTYQFPVGFLFVVCSSDYKSFEQVLAEYDFNYPVIYDEQDEFDKLNEFPSKPYNTFLLNENNKVLLVGTPILSPKKWKEYKERIVNGM